MELSSGSATHQQIQHHYKPTETMRSFLTPRHVFLSFLIFTMCLSLAYSSETINSSSSSSPRGESAFYADEVRQNANTRQQRYSHVRRTWLAARERTLRGRRLERLQADAAATSSSSSSSPPPMFMVEAKPIKKSIDELQAVVLRQSSQGYKDMLRALMVSCSEHLICAWLGFPQSDS